QHCIEPITTPIPKGRYIGSSSTGRGGSPNRPQRQIRLGSIVSIAPTFNAWEEGHMIARFQALKLAPCPRSLAPTSSLMPVRLGPSMSLIPFAPFSVLRWFVASALLLNGLAIAQI